MTYDLVLGDDGGVTLPPELLNSLGWGTGTQVEFLLDGDVIRCREADSAKDCEE